MIERCFPHSPPRIPPTNDQRWAARKPLYDAVRNDERAYEYERAREELLSQSPEYQQ